MLRSLLVLSVLVLFALPLFGGGQAEPDLPPEPQDFEVPPSIPGVPDFSPALVTPDDTGKIALAYREFADSGELLLAAVRQRGLEWAASGLQSFRNTLADWRRYWTDFRSLPDDDELTAETVQEFYKRIGHEDERLALVVKALNEIIDSQRVLTTDKFKLN